MCSSEVVLLLHLLLLRVGSLESTLLHCHPQIFRRVMRLHSRLALHIRLHLGLRDTLKSHGHPLNRSVWQVVLNGLRLGWWPHLIVGRLRMSNLRHWNSKRARPVGTARCSITLWLTGHTGHWLLLTL